MNRLIVTTDLLWCFIKGVTFDAAADARRRAYELCRGAADFLCDEPVHERPAIDDLALRVACDHVIDARGHLLALCGALTGPVSDRTLKSAARAIVAAQESINAALEAFPPVPNRDTDAI